MTNQEKFRSLGRFFVAIAMAAFGIQHIIYGDFVTRLVPGLPGWIPWHPAWAYLTGIALIAASTAILLGKHARLVAIVLGAIILLSILFVYLTLLASDPASVVLWVNMGKALTLSGSSFLVAGSLAAGSSADDESGLLSVMVPLGRFFLAAFLVFCGIQHFLLTEFVAGLVPSWIPGHIFWTYFAGVALIAGGVGIMIPITTRLAGALTALMLFLWVILLHIPRALADISHPNEMTAVFEALAMSGMAILIACAQPKTSSTAIESVPQKWGWREREAARL